ncbi:unnamed protein product [Caenorhabditis sp. 36 PRJEB53466]|nr:unnamed protein product [Caenorhabditis sp. 36 PRJEB53466]
MKKVFQMSQESKISQFLNGKPQIAPVAESSLLSRLRTFLPQMEEANRNMPEGGPSDAFQIENVREESSDSDSDISDEESDGNEAKEVKVKAKKVDGDRIEIDLDVFREENSAVDGRDVSVQDVEALPAAFRTDADPKKEESPRKPLIEEM